MIRKLICMVMLALAASLVGCAGQMANVEGVEDAPKQTMRVSSSFLLSKSPSLDGKDSTEQKTAEARKSNDDSNVHAATKTLQPIGWPASGVGDIQLLSDLLPEEGSFEAAVEKMSVRDFINYTFGELLEINYVLDESIGDGSASESDLVTLSLTEPVTARALFTLVSDMLIKKGIIISHGADTFFINKSDESVGGYRAIVGIGRDITDVPNTAQKIVQVVPLQYGIKLNVERTLRSLIKAKITPDFEQSALFIEGSREEIIHALELVGLLDTPSTRSRYVSLIGLNFLTPDVFTRDVKLLLESEGIEASIGRPEKRNVVMVPLEHLGAVAVFAVTESLLRRVQQWASLIDVPGEGSNEQYFIYYPENARAVDLGESLSALLGAGAGGRSQVGLSNGGSSTKTTGNAPSSSRIAGVTAGDLRMVIDERANALIYFTSGSRYRALLPLMQKLDTMPQQVLLDITIAEVTLKDEFKYGVEWAISRGEVNVVTAGAFGVTNIGGMGMVIDGAEGPLEANFLSTNSLVNVLSKPSLLVRDGVTANINVGSDISVVGATTQDPINGERQTTTSEYRKTGVDVTVTPTVNAQGIVVMEIQQTISNSVPSSSGASGNPDIFERSLSTELVAKSGQTVMMAGLISESASKGGAGTPFIRKIPLIGNLFKASNDSTDRTELVMLITPRVIENLNEWETVMSDFREGLRYIDIETE